ncbi:MAG: hypothetical protein CL666_10435 [Balneola sp.]|nr:hypothetical protein [Balneola sp.]|tara:strand:+ start:23207 stop:23974 length:768 start_codon:yes stop_codon:yes gene_type:complete
MNLQPFCFPVTLRTVAVDNAKSPLIDIDDQESFLPNGYKAIVREDTNEVISIVKDSYKIVKNNDLIDQLLRSLATSGYQFRIDPSHSFVENNRMRLMITFPELLFRDGESDIALSAFIHNSYDQSEGVRFYFGAIRKICSNGMVFGQILSKYYSKHTSGFSFEDLGEKLADARDYFPVIQERINRLETLRVDEQLVENVSNKISKRLAEQVIEQEEIGRITQWEMLNRLTNYVSHDLDQRHRARYQDNISKVFAL